jgi:hypothetical protein
LIVSFSTVFFLALAPFLPGHFDEKASNCSHSIRLVQGFRTLVSESNLELFVNSYI